MISFRSFSGSEGAAMVIQSCIASFGPSSCNCLLISIKSVIASLPPWLKASRSIVINSLVSTSSGIARPL